MIIKNEILDKIKKLEELKEGLLSSMARYLMDSIDNPIITYARKGQVAKSFSELEFFLKPFIKNNGNKVWLHA